LTDTTPLEQKKRLIRNFVENFTEYLQESHSSQISDIIQEIEVLEKRSPFTLRDAWQVTKLNKQLARIQKEMDVEFTRRKKLLGKGLDACDEKSS